MKLTGNQRKQIAKDVLRELSDKEHNEFDYSDEYKHLRYSLMYLLEDNFDLKDIEIEEDD